MNNKTEAERKAIDNSFKPKSLSKHEYLYGKDAEHIEVPDYIIMRKIEQLREHLKELMDEPYMTRDEERANAVMKGIAFWNSINLK